ncbi:MAG: hypothetical protein WCY19_00770 [Candidatus Gastranaerophilaceae bacterium]
MTDYLTLTEFVPGTKAKAQEVNANFSALKDALSEKAAMDGDSTQTFSVANATQNAHAINKGQLDSLSNDLTAELKKMSTKFCVKYGNTTAGNGDLFSYNVLEITPKIGGTYKNLVMADYQGTQTTISSAAAISMSGKPNGDYNIFITAAGVLYTLDNTIYRQAARPTMLAGDVWFNTSAEPFSCIKYDGTNDVEFLDVPLGSVTIASSAITEIVTFPFNQNGHNVTTQTIPEAGTNLALSVVRLIMPDYKSVVSKAWNTILQAESDGWLYPNGGNVASSSMEDFTLTYSFNSDLSNSFEASAIGANTTAGIMVPIIKGMYYRATRGTANQYLKFYPCLGV